MGELSSNGKNVRTQKTRCAIVELCRIDPLPFSCLKLNRPSIGPSSIATTLDPARRELRTVLLKHSSGHIAALKYRHGRGFSFLRFSSVLKQGAAGSLDIAHGRLYGRYIHVVDELDLCNSSYLMNAAYVVTQSARDCAAPRALYRWCSCFISVNQEGKARTPENEIRLPFYVKAKSSTYTCVHFLNKA